MKWPLLSIIVSASVFLSACKKETTPAFYINATFETENTVLVNPVRLFTRGGEITDPQLIVNFISRHTTQLGFQNHFLFGVTSQALDPSLSMKITFRDNNSATIERNSVFLIPYVWETHEADFSNLDASTLKITERDSINSSLLVGSACENTMNSLLSFLPNGTSLQLGNTLHSRWKYYFPVITTNKQIKIPTIIRLVAHKDLNFCVYIKWEENRNIFNSAAITSLYPSDTIAIQTKEIVFKKI